MSTTAPCPAQPLDLPYGHGTAVAGCRSWNPGRALVPPPAVISLNTRGKS